MRAQVVRLSVVDKSVDEMVKELHDVVVQRKDQLAEAEIQAMYSANNDVTRLYSKNN